MAITKSSQALKQLQTLRKQKVSGAKLLSQAEKRLGVGDVRAREQGLRTAISNTENLIRQVDPSVTGRTAGTFATEAQRTALINKERQPLGEQLTTQSGALSNESANLNDLSQRAVSEAQLAAADYEDRLTGMESLYERLYKREQDAIALAEARKAAARSGGGGGGYGLGGGFVGGGGGGSAGGGGGSARMTQRRDGGFDFTIEGKPVSAAVYANATGKSFRSVLSLMAKKGDQGAVKALRFVGDDYGYDPRKVATQGLADLYNSLVWGSGLSASPTATPAGRSGAGVAVRKMATSPFWNWNK